MVLDNYGDRWYSTSGSTTANGSYQTLIPATGVQMVERLSFQFINSGAAKQDVKVYGTLDTGVSTLGGSRWSQIGDTITVSSSTASLKSISTTGLMFVGVTASGAAAGSRLLDYNMLVQNL